LEGRALETGCSADGGGGNRHADRGHGPCLGAPGATQACNCRFRADFRSAALPGLEFQNKSERGKYGCRRSCLRACQWVCGNGGPAGRSVPCGRCRHTPAHKSGGDRLFFSSRPYWSRISGAAKARDGGDAHYRSSFPAYPGARRMARR
jgi:hypothetical protein